MFIMSNLSDLLLQFWQLRQMPSHHLISHNSDSSLRPNHDSLLLILKLVCRSRCSQDMTDQLKNSTITICNFIISLILFSSIFYQAKNKSKEFMVGPKGFDPLAHRLWAGYSTKLSYGPPEKQVDMQYKMV